MLIEMIKNLINLLQRLFRLSEKQILHLINTMVFCVLSIVITLLLVLTPKHLLKVLSMGLIMLTLVYNQSENIVRAYYSIVLPELVDDHYINFMIHIGTIILASLSVFTSYLAFRNENIYQSFQKML